MSRLADGFLQALYPNRCIFCREVVARGAYCCARCEQKLPWIPAQDRMQAPKPFGGALVWNFSAFFYTGGIQRAIGDFKFLKRKETGQKLALLLCKGLQDALGASSLPFDLVTCVPMTKEKEEERGYNQANILGTEVAAFFGVEYAPALLERHTPLTQHHLNRSFRRQSVAASFFLHDGTKAAGRRILMADDIYTTGATLQYCAYLLQDAGAEAVFSATVARSSRA